MEQLLARKLHAYVAENNPDVLIALQEEYGVSQYLYDKARSVELLIARLRQEQKPAYIIEELCMEELTADLKPSKYNFLASVLQDEFEDTYYRYRETGVLLYELLNILEACRPVFEEKPLTRSSEDDRFLRYAVTGAVKEYLDKTDAK